MKPWGLTADFRVIQPTPAEDKVWEAVEEAQDAGWTVEQFRRECAQAWSGALRERADRDAREWERDI